MPRQWNEWRARQIADPVARLRYLRRGAAVRRRWAANAPVALIAAALFAVPQNVFAPPVPGGRLSPDRPPSAVWKVETRSGIESFSNGLQIDATGTVRNQPRAGEPQGLVFHTSESQLAELRPEANARLRQLGRGLLDYVRGERAYHFLVDRFGRVFRVVAEEDIAFHAGHSIWADGAREFTELNREFLGIVFESQSRPADEAAEMTPAQVRSGRLLVDMLRSRHVIEGRNCVTHAQVSVNPANYRVGWHTDWAGSFPFEAMGLPDNYELPVAAVSRFGFSYDAAFFAATGARLWVGLVAAENLLRAQSAARGVAVAELRRELRRRYAPTVSNENKEIAR